MCCLDGYFDLILVKTLYALAELFKLYMLVEHLTNADSSMGGDFFWFV